MAKHSVCAIAVSCSIFPWIKICQQRMCPYFVFWPKDWARTFLSFWQRIIFKTRWCGQGSTGSWHQGEDGVSKNLRGFVVKTESRWVRGSLTVLHTTALYNSTDVLQYICTGIAYKYTLKEKALILTPGENKLILYYLFINLYHKT